MSLNPLEILRTRLSHAQVGVRQVLLLQHRLPHLYDAAVKVYQGLVGTTIRVEASSQCQLRCPKCPTGRRVIGKSVVGWGWCKANDFRRLLVENPQVKEVELSNWGEIFLNPELPEILQAAHERGVALRANNGVNLNTLSWKLAEALVKYQFSYLSVSIDGASQDTYAQYRRKGIFQKVLRNLERINHFKLEYQSRLPRLTWQFIVFGHNEHELPLARQLATQHGMGFKPKLNHSPAFSPIRDAEYVRRETGLGVATRDEFAARHQRQYSFPCVQLWDSPQINWDGTLLGCCVNKYGSFGNVFETGLQAALQGETYRYAKEMVTGRKPPREDVPCFRCNVYRRLNPHLT
jgi:MoaA/NifB/PqqE/SkfB family radical SAM enzyme